MIDTLIQWVATYLVCGYIVCFVLIALGLVLGAFGWAVSLFAGEKCSHL